MGHIATSFVLSEQRIQNSHAPKLQSSNIWSIYGIEDDPTKPQSALEVEHPNGSLFRIFKTIKTPSGNPLTFGCPSRVRKTILKKVELGRRCNSVVSYGDEGLLTIRFHDKSVPPEDLEDLIKYLAPLALNRNSKSEYLTYRVL